MPSSEDCIAAKNQVKQSAINVLVKKGHPRKSAEEIVKYMPYDDQIKLAEKEMGKIYRGTYSPY